MKSRLDGFKFQRVGALRLKRHTDGRIVEYVHQLPQGVRPNRYSPGPFCSFELAEASKESGVYAIVVGDDIKYVGECEDLRRRFGPIGYGHVAARNCHSDGQATNCKINALVLQASRQDQPVDVWFLPSADRKPAESQLIAEFAPSWNGTRPMQAGRAAQGENESAVDDVAGFATALRAELAAAERSGQRSIRIRSGDLHSRVGGYPAVSHRMPTCCKVMKSIMVSGDRIVTSPPKGAGANLVIEYRLPRMSLSGRPAGASRIDLATLLKPDPVTKGAGALGARQS